MADEFRVGPVRFYLHTLTLLIRQRMAFRVNYYLMTLSVLIKEAAAIALIGVILQKFHAVAGWTIWEIGVLYSLMAFANRGFYTFCAGVLRIGHMVESGELDQFLVTPRNPLFLVSARYACAWRMLYNCATLLILAFCSSKAGVEFSPGNIALFAVFAVSAVAIHFAIYLVLATVALWTFRVSAMQELLYQVIFEYLRYPIQIYGVVGAFLLTWLIPLAFINYYPAATLLAKTNDVFIGPSLGYAAPLVAALLLFAAYRFWNFGLAYYKSSGT